MLLAVAIYDDSEYKKTGKCKKIASAERRETSFFSSSKMAELEKKSLPALLSSINVNNTYVGRVDDEFHYLIKFPGDNFIMAINSLRKFDDETIYRLFNNLRHAHLRPHIVNMQDMVNNHINYTGRDKLIEVTLKEIGAVREIMLRNIDLALANSEKLDDLVKKTEELQTVSLAFKKKSTDLNKCCRIL